MKLIKPTVAFTAVLSLLTGCATVQVNEPAETFTPRPFLPQTSLTVGANLEPKPITNEVSVLKESFSKFSISEYLSGGDKDYSLTWNAPYAVIDVPSEATKSSKRERDAVSLTLAAPDLEVYTDGTTEISVSMLLNAEGRKIRAFCNGTLFEVAGEAFKIPSTGDCDDPVFASNDYDFQSFLFGNHWEGSSNAEQARMFNLLSQNSFTVKVVDTDNVEHIFKVTKSKKGSPFPSPQDSLRIGFEAEKAVLKGLGY